MDEALVEAGPSRRTLDAIDGSGQKRALAVGSGRAEDAYIMRRVGRGIAIGVPLGVVLTCAVVAVSLAVAGSFAAGSLLAGLWGGLLGGAYLGAVIAYRDPDHAPAAASEAAGRVEPVGPRMAA